MRRRFKVRIVLPLFLALGVVLATGGARAWEPNCEDTNPNANYEYQPRQGVMGFVPVVYRDGGNYWVACGKFPKDNLIPKPN